MPPKEAPEKGSVKHSFYSELPNWSKVMLQLGFAGVVCLLFIMDSRDRSAQLKDMVNENRLQAREDRTMFREELKVQREVLAEAVQEMKRAVDKLNQQHQTLKKDVEGLKPIGVAPPPHKKVPE